MNTIIKSLPSSLRQFLSSLIERIRYMNPPKTSCESFPLNWYEKGLLFTLSSANQSTNCFLSRVAFTSCSRACTYFLHCNWACQQRTEVILFERLLSARANRSICMGVQHLDCIIFQMQRLNYSISFSQSTPMGGSNSCLHFMLAIY